MGNISSNTDGTGAVKELVLIPLCMCSILALFTPASGVVDDSQDYLNYDDLGTSSNKQKERARWDLPGGGPVATKKQPSGVQRSGLVCIVTPSGIVFVSQQVCLLVACYEYFIFLVTLSLFILVGF